MIEPTPIVVQLADVTDIPINDPASRDLEIDRLCRQLGAAGLELGKRIEELADVEIEYGDAFDAALDLLVAEYASGRLPGEDARKSLIHRNYADVRSLYHRKHRLEKRVEAVEKWSRLVTASLNGRQSQLSKLKSEEFALRSRA